MSVPKPSKALETVPCMKALTILSRANAKKKKKVAASGSQFKVLVLLLLSKMKDKVTGLFLLFLLLTE